MIGFLNFNELMNRKCSHLRNCRVCHIKQHLCVAQVSLPANGEGVGHAQHTIVQHRHPFQTGVHEGMSAKFRVNLQGVGVDLEAIQGW